MPMTRRQFVAASTLAGAVAFLTACSPPAQKPGSPLTIWNNLDSPEQVAYYEKHFVKAYTKHRVEFSSKASNTIDRLIQTALAARGGPSIIVTPGPSSFVSAYTSAGYLADLTAAMKTYGWDRTFAPWALQASQIDGRLMTLPASYESMAFYYNPAVLDELGLTPPKDLAEFENFCEEAEGHGRVPLAAGNADYKGANEWFVGVGLNHAAGPEAMYSALMGETSWKDPVFVDAIEQLAGWFKKGWFGGGVDRYFTNPFATVYRQLASGDAAGMISGTWEFPNLAPYFGAEADNDATWDWTTIPSMGAETTGPIWDLAIGQSVGVNTNVADVEAAIEYLDFLTTDLDTFIPAVEEASFALPPIHVDSSDFSAKADERVVRLYDQLSSAKAMGYTTWTFFPQQTETYMINYFENVITGDMSAEEYCAGVDDLFSAELAQGRVPVAPHPDGGVS